MTDLVELGVKIDPRSLARVTRTLDRYQGKPLAERMDRAVRGGASLLAGPIRAQAPKGRTGGLKASVKVQRRGKSYNRVGYAVGPTKRVPDRQKSALLTAILVYGSKKRGIERNPFVDRAAAPLLDRVVKFVDEQITRLG